MPLASAVRVSPTCTLADLESLLAGAALRTSHAANAKLAVQGLQSLALASGSLQTSLRLAGTLLVTQVRCHCMRIEIYVSLAFNMTISPLVQPEKASTSESLVSQTTIAYSSIVSPARAASGDALAQQLFNSGGCG